jgi:hypothetical protein
MSVVALSSQEDLPTHAALTTAMDVAASQELRLKPEKQSPVGVPKDAKATLEKVEPLHVAVSDECSARLVQYVPAG